jgi:tetratricopeptide (TPR) repeat protein
MKLNIYNKIFLPLFVSFLLSGQLVFPQDVDIVPLLKKIERGSIEEVKNELRDLKEEHPQSPSVMFLEGVLTENGQQAVVVYQNVVDNYPNSKYADAALYRIFSYYYALGLYETARGKLKQLVHEYPESPYINIAKDNKFPDNSDLSELDGVTSQQDTETGTGSGVEGDYQFTIQAGAFTNSGNAISLQKEFERSGIFSEVREKNVGGTTFHVVYVGKFVKLEDAENFLQVINSRFNLSGRITPIIW